MRTHHGSARGNGKRVNQITHFGIMGGLAPQRNASVSVIRAFKEGHAKLQQQIPLKPKPGLRYMMGHNPTHRYLLSKNPVGSGMVGVTPLLVSRRH
tara:strand:+ start:1187 stop:1474 length:288 start_codon:yes stop_codon:yes gene_type:complete